MSIRMRFPPITLHAFARASGNYQYRRDQLSQTQKERATRRGNCNVHDPSIPAKAVFPYTAPGTEL